MDRAQALALLTRYYAAFNAGDWAEQPGASVLPPVEVVDLR